MSIGAGPGADAALSLTLATSPQGEQQQDGAMMVHVRRGQWLVITARASGGKTHIPGPGGYYYYWGEDIGIDRAHPERIQTLPMIDVDVTVTVKDDDAKMVSATAHIKVVAPDSDFSVTASTDMPGPVAPGTMVTLDATAQGGKPGYSYHWTAGDSSPIVQPDLKTIRIPVTAPTTFTVRAQDTDGHMASARVSIAVQQNPAAAFELRIEPDAYPTLVNAGYTFTAMGVRVPVAQERADALHVSERDAIRLYEWGTKFYGDTMPPEWTPTYDRRFEGSDAPSGAALQTSFGEPGWWLVSLRVTDNSNNVREAEPLFFSIQ